MPFCILESSRDPFPSGTSILNDGGSSKNPPAVNIVLAPTPSGSAFDPLNWPRHKKELLFATIIFGSCATGSLGPVLVPGFTEIANYLEVDLASMALLNGSLVMALGVSSYLCSCFAYIYGKRVVYILTTLILLASCCWAAASRSFASLVASRVLQGLGMGAFFSLAGTASINDVWFVHERGLRVGLWNFGVIVSVNLTPVISGYVISNLSWRWSFWLEAILFGILFGGVLTCFPETTFCRETNGDVVVDDAAPSQPNPEQHKGEKAAFEAGPPTIVDTAAVLTARPGSKNSKSRFKFLLGLSGLRIRDQRCIHWYCIKPIRMLLHPVVVWGCVTWAVTFSWTILLGAVVSQIFGAPPFKLSTTAVGNLSGIAPFIGSALGTISGGWACDRSAQMLAYRNRGVYEPEFRLVVMAPAIIAMACGTFGLGAVIDGGMSPIVCGLFMAIINFALGLGCTAIVAYMNDVCGKKAGDAFGIAMVAKSAFAFGLTFAFNEFYARVGAMTFFSVFGAVTVGALLTTLPMYVYGKQLRAWADGCFLHIE